MLDNKPRQDEIVGGIRRNHGQQVSVSSTTTAMSGASVQGETNARVDLSAGDTEANVKQGKHVEMKELSEKGSLPEGNSVSDLLGLAPRRSHLPPLKSPPRADHMVRITEVVPAHDRPLVDHGSQGHSLSRFTSKKTDVLGMQVNKLPKGIRTYYKRQDELIASYENLASDSRINMLREQASAPSTTLITRLSQISFAANLVLMVAKAVAVGLSNSLSIISSLVDSVVDLVAGLIIWWTSRAIKRSNIYVYPIGRSRLEPVAVIILSVIMSLASFEVIITSVRKVIDFTKNLDEITNFDIPTVIIASSTVVTKLLLAVSFCLIVKKKELQSSAVNALIQDHRNDTISNLMAIVCGYLGSRQFAAEVHTQEVAYIDPAGAILIGLYIIISWWRTGIAQLRMITGYTADPGFLSQLTWIALNHSPQIQCLDTVRAFHFGSKFLVEVDIVLHADTRLVDSHNVGESLQQKLEKLAKVERAFVHVDYESEHNPQEEHLQD
ncbi:metal tolerance protein 9 [Aplysia californica]|uniref:Metal tolerance protein 9 n=1 Tax=Aplysia californica TaxID=6500 RepID=A0ABM1AD17_APLCA|nr:metal tolerance protein 9 [Aplysia californica]